MKTRHIFILLLTIGFYLLGYGESFSDSIPKTSTDKKDESVDKDIQRILNSSRIKYDLPAISLGIKFPNSNNIHHYVSGYDTASSKSNITEDTLFQIGSITKTFTAAIIFQLIENQKLKGSDYLLEFLPQYSRWKKITVYDLLHHLSGVSNYSSGKTFDRLLRENPDRSLSLGELANMAYQKKDFSSPGKKYHYTNTDYILLGMIVEKVTHKSLDQIFYEFFKKYDLHNTFYSSSSYPRNITDRMAHGYNRDGTFNFNTDVTFVSPSYYQSAGGMISAPHDLVKWLNKLFSGKVISPHYFQEMTKIISENDTKPINPDSINLKKYKYNSKPFVEIGVGAGVGLIYFQKCGLTWVHAGGTPGYEAFYAYNPSKGIYLALAYSVKPKEQLVFIKIADRVFQRLCLPRKIPNVRIKANG